MSKKSFLDLLDRYQQGNCTERERFLVEEWYGSLNNEDHLLLTSTELSQMSDRILLRLRANMERQVKKQPAFHINWYKTAIAASITIAMICTFLYTFNYNYAERSFYKQNAGTAMLSQTNHTGKDMTVVLSDRSQVILKPNAKISYPSVFRNNQRVVYLNGDAFFKVSKNREKPFYVYNKNLKVKVLGTSFLVQEAEAQVSVSTGKVEVNENANRELISFPGKKRAASVLITPNQKAVFDEHHHQLITTLVEQPKPLYQLNHQPQAISFNFSENTLKDVFDTLSGAYGIEISLEDPKIYQCTFTGDLDNKNLEEQLNLICQSISGKYTVKGTKMLVTGQNCN